MDRTNEYIEAVQRAIMTLKLPQAVSIHDLRRFIKLQQNDYVTEGRYGSRDKDRVEEEVGLSVKACRRTIDQLKDSVVAASGARSAAAAGLSVLNEHTSAHLHGVVLHLVEELASVTASFDRCRALRYQMATEKELLQRRRPRSSAVVAAKHTASWSDGAPTGSGAAPGTSSSTIPLQTQELQEENAELMAELSSTLDQATSIETTLREVTTLNQLMSNAVLQQAKVIDRLYHEAVEATVNISKGNQSLRKTVETNRSTRLYIIALLLSASLLLLFFDWFNS